MVKAMERVVVEYFDEGPMTKVKKGLLEQEWLAGFKLLHRRTGIQLLLCHHIRRV